MKKPDWIRFSIPGGPEYVKIKKIVKELDLHTVCLEAHCPNFGECTSRGTATFLILGNICTRNCSYCSIKNDRPLECDNDEPYRISLAVAELSLKHAVITSVTRDDLEDGGAFIFSKTVKAVKKLNPRCSVELLIPDFRNSCEYSLEKIIQSKPDVINHNLEVCRSMFNKHRPEGNYDLSLEILKKSASSHILTKSGLMVGLGETTDDIFKSILDLSDAGCSFITVGQYLQSSKKSTPVKKYYTPDEFKQIKAFAEKTGIKTAVSGPLVRSSYRAGDIYNSLKVST